MSRDYYTVESKDMGELLAEGILPRRDATNFLQNVIAQGDKRKAEAAAYAAERKAEGRGVPYYHRLCSTTVIGRLEAGGECRVKRGAIVRYTAEIKMYAGGDFHTSVRVMARDAGYEQANEHAVVFMRLAIDELRDSLIREKQAEQERKEAGRRKEKVIAEHERLMGVMGLPLEAPSVIQGHELLSMASVFERTAARLNEMAEAARAATENYEAIPEKAEAFVSDYHSEFHYGIAKGAQEAIDCLNDRMRKAAERHDRESNLLLKLARKNIEQEAGE